SPRRMRLRLHVPSGGSRPQLARLTSTLEVSKMMTMTRPSSQTAAVGPLQFVPYIRPLVWGGERLGRVLGKPIPPGQPGAESWAVSDHRSHASIVAGGAWAGRSLRQLMTEQREALLGPAAPASPIFPWLIKLLDAHDWLSVQVHPDDELARRLWPGEGGKT